MPTPDDALPGRDTPIPTSANHLVLGTPIGPPFPEGTEQGDLRDGLLLGRRADVLAGARACTRRPSATRAASRRTRRTRRSARAGRGTTRSCSPSSIPEQTSYEELLQVFWEGHDPTQGMRQGNDVGTQYRSGIYWTSEAQRDAAIASRDMFQEELSRRRLRANHDRDRRSRAVLLRRGLPPAVPGGEPERLLRPWRDWRVVPCRSDSGERLTTGVPAGMVPSRAASDTTGSRT